MTPEPPDLPFGPPPDQVPASPSQRLAGALVDGAALQLAGLALWPLSQETAAAVAALVYLAYELSFVAWRGQTPAKMAVGTRVVDAAAGGRPSLWQAATRAVVPLAGVIADVALGAPGVGALWVMVVYGLILWDDRRRGLHDRAAGTVVVLVERSPAHRRVGTAAVVVAVAVTAVFVALALDETRDGRPAAWAPARR